MKRIKFFMLFLILAFTTVFHSCELKDKDLTVKISEIKVLEADNEGIITLIDELPINVVITPENATNKKLKYKSDNEDVFTPSVSGILYAVNPGQATLTIQTIDGSGYTASYIVNVIEVLHPITEIKLPENVSISTGQLWDMSQHVAISPDNATNKKLTYASSNDSIFTVSEDGLIKGLGVGTATLTVSTKDGSDISATCDVIVSLVPVTGIELNTTSATIFAEQTFNLGNQITIYPLNAGNKSVTYTSSNETIAKVSADGIITGLDRGTATITVTTVDGGFSKTFEITVIQELLNRSAWTLTHSHQWFLEAGVCFEGYALIDDDPKTNVGFVKPGKSAGGITVPESDKVFFIVDIKQEEEFDYFIYSHRTTNSSATIKSKQVGIYGSNTGTAESDFTLIKKEIPIAASPNDIKVTLDKKETYRYVKVVFEDWDKAAGNTIQLSEFRLGLTY